MTNEDIIISLDTAKNLYQGPRAEIVAFLLTRAISVIQEDDFEDIDWQDPTAIYLENS